MTPEQIADYIENEWYTNPPRRRVKGLDEIVVLTAKAAQDVVFDNYGLCR